MPNLQRLGTVRVGETPVEKLNLALELEKEAIDRLNNGIALCVAAGDNGSRELLDTSSKARKSTPTGSSRSSS